VEAASWQITGSACKPARDTLELQKVFPHFELAYEAVNQFGESLIVLHCPLSTVKLDGPLNLATYYQDPDGAGEIEVRAFIYRMDKRSDSGGEVGWVCLFFSNDDGDVTDLDRQLASVPCDAAFDTDTYIYGAIVAMAMPGPPGPQRPAFYGMELWR
jgi:hypothetical protein